MKHFAHVEHEIDMNEEEEDDDGDEEEEVLKVVT